MHVRQRNKEKDVVMLKASERWETDKHKREREREMFLYLSKPLFCATSRWVFKRYFTLSLVASSSSHTSEKKNSTPFSQCATKRSLISIYLNIFSNVDSFVALNVAQVSKSAHLIPTWNNSGGFPCRRETSPTFAD